MRATSKVSANNGLNEIGTYYNPSSSPNRQVEKTLGDSDELCRVFSSEICTFGRAAGGDKIAVEKICTDL